MANKSAPRAEAPPVEIRTEGLFKAFNGHRVLEGVDLEIRSGEIVAIDGGAARPGRGVSFDALGDSPARTTLIITHDKDLLIRLEPRTVMLHQGRVAFDGPFARFKAAADPIIRPYFDLMPVLHQRAVMAARP